MKGKERDLLASLADRKTQETVQILTEILLLRFERHKSVLVARSCELTRGKAQEVRDLLKALDIDV